MDEGPRFFADAGAWRAWLTRHHADAAELQVGFHRAGSGTPGMRRKEAIDEALCFGWIDGVVKRLDADRYAVRFTPRRPGSIWSTVNIERVRALTELGRMAPPGLKAFAGRRADRSAVYSYEQRDAPAFAPEQAAALRENPAAWSFFAAQAPWYRRAAIWWVTSAKRADTRTRRLATLIDDSAHGRRLGHLTPPRVR